jgi:hypothetical protein
MFNELDIEKSDDYGLINALPHPLTEKASLKREAFVFISAYFDDGHSTPVGEFICTLLRVSWANRRLRLSNVRVDGDSGRNLRANCRLGWQESAGSR